MNRIFIAIDLKSFYASVECVERNLDPLTTNLVVADISRTEKTICLAVTPSLKSYGIKGRARLFEVVQKVKEINKKKSRIKGSSTNINELNSNPSLALDYIVAQPRMALYIKYSTKIYAVYLRYIAPEDIYVYSIDEVFIDVTRYLKTYKTAASELAMKLIHEVLKETGITATAGIGTNMFLAKVAMDIVAKKIPADENGVRIAELDEMSFRRNLWDHQPLTDFWRIGHGIARRLEDNGMFTMGDICLKSLEDEDFLYNIFGINAELIIDHAWGYEPCTIEDVKAYKPLAKSLGTGQVLHCAYSYDKAKLIVKEMIDSLSLDMVEKKLVTNQLILTVGYDVDNLKDEQISKEYQGEIIYDYLGRATPKYAHGTANLEKYTSSTKILTKALVLLYERIIDDRLSIRRINISANVVSTQNIPSLKDYQQLDIFTDYEEQAQKNKVEEEELEKEKKQQEAIIKIKKKYGKNAVVKGMNLEEGATMKERNKQIGGHKA